MKKLTALLLTALLAVSPFPLEICAGENTVSSSRLDAETAGETEPDVSPVRYRYVHGDVPSDGVSVYPWNDLIVFQENGLYGCKNTNDGFICEAKYESIVGANGFVLAVEPNGDHTLLDYNGEVRMNAGAFEKAMSGGYEVNNSNIGENIVGLYKDSADKYVDFQGDEYASLTKLLAESPAGTTSYMQEGLIKIADSDRLSQSGEGSTFTGLGTTYFVDHNGNEALPREQGYAYMDFSGGLVLRVKLEPGYPLNEEVTPLAFYDAKGRLVCEVPEAANGKNSYVCFVEQDLETRLQFSEAGLAAFQDKDTGLYGFFNKKGEITIPARYEYCVLKFQGDEGIAGVTLPGSDLLTYIDMTGYELFSIPWPSPWPANISNGLFVNTYLEEQEDGYTVKREARDMRGAQVFAMEAVSLNGEITDFAYIFGEGTPVPSDKFIDMAVDTYSRTVITQTADNNFILLDMNGLEIMPSRYFNFDYEIDSETMPPRYESILPLETEDGRLLLYKDGAYKIIEFDTRYFQYNTQPEDEPRDYESRQTYIINGETVAFSAVNRGVSNFVKLDELCKSLNIDIAYDCLTLTVYTDKTKPYAGTRSLLADLPETLAAVSSANPYAYRMEPGDIGELQSRVVSGQTAITGQPAYGALPISPKYPYPRVATAENQAPERMPSEFDYGLFIIKGGYYYYSIGDFARINDIFIAYDIDRNEVILDKSKPWKSIDAGDFWWSPIDVYFAIPEVDSSGAVVSAISGDQVSLNEWSCASPSVIDNGFTLEARYEKHPYADVFRVTEYAASPGYPVEEVIFESSGLQILFPTLKPGVKPPLRAVDTVLNFDNDWTEEYMNRRGRIFRVTVNGEYVEGSLEPYKNGGYRYIFPPSFPFSVSEGEIKTIRVEIREPASGGEDDFLNSIDGLAIQDIAYKVAQAILRADAEELSRYMSDPAGAVSAVQNLTDIYDAPVSFDLVWSPDNIVSDERVKISYRYTVNGEDSNWYVSMTLNKADGVWKVDWIGIEK